MPNKTIKPPWGRPLLNALFFMLRPLDRHLARRDEAKLKQDIRRELPFLFEQHHGQFVPNQGVPFPPGFDYAYVTVAVDDLLLRFCRGRGGVDIRVAPKDAPEELSHFVWVLGLIEANDELKRRTLWNLSEAAQVLEPGIDRIQEAFSSDSAGELRQQLAAAGDWKWATMRPK